jgi:hypothetical protein
MRESLIQKQSHLLGTNDVPQLSDMILVRIPQSSDMVLVRIPQSSEMKPDTVPQLSDTILVPQLSDVNTVPQLSDMNTVPQLFDMNSFSRLSGMNSVLQLSSDMTSTNINTKLMYPNPQLFDIMMNTKMNTKLTHPVPQLSDVMMNTNMNTNMDTNMNTNMNTNLMNTDPRSHDIFPKITNKYETHNESEEYKIEIIPKSSFNVNISNQNIKKAVECTELDTLSNTLSHNHQNEQNLIKELKLSRDIMMNNNNEFEKELMAFNYDIDIDIVVKKSFARSSENTFQFQKIHSLITHKTCCLNFVLQNEYEYVCDAVGDPYLLMKKNIYDLDYETLQDVLGITVELVIGGAQISKFNLAANILIAKLCGKEILIDESSTKIPLMIMHSSNGDTVESIALQYHGLNIELNKIDDEILDKIGDLELILTRYFYPGAESHYDKINRLPNSEVDLDIGQSISKNYVHDKNAMNKRRFVAQTASKNMIIDSTDFRLSMSESIGFNMDTYTEKIKLSAFTKYIFFRFIPKRETVGEMGLVDNRYDLLSLCPSITGVEIIKNGSIILSIKQDDFQMGHCILSMNIIKTTVYVISLSSDATNWKDIKESIKTCNFVHNYARFGNVEVKITTDISCDNYDVIMTTMKYNINSYISGMMGVMYGE